MNNKFVLRNYIYYLKGEKKPYSGDYAEYWSITDVLKETFHLIDGKIEGLYKRYYDNGMLAEVGFYKDGQANGHFKSYYPDGQLETDLHYREDKLDGYCEYFRQDGSLHSIDEYSFDELLQTKKF